MGYTTVFKGKVAIDPPLNAEEINYLNCFAGTRRVRRVQGAYYVDYPAHRPGWWAVVRSILFHAKRDMKSEKAGVIDNNKPPEGQPGLHCQWVPTEDGLHLEWNGIEKFYYSLEWMEYLIDHFLGPNPKAKSQLPFLEGHILNGEIYASGEDEDDRWILTVVENEVACIEETHSR